MAVLQVLRLSRTVYAAAAALILTLVGCAGIRTSPVAGHVSESQAAAEAGPRTLFVLFDGTHNDEKSQTNVFALKRVIERSTLPATVFYVEGVGALEDTQLLGNVLGLGMEERINAGYTFLSERHRAGDRIVIAGFSRGAHQARALAGLVAYAGLLNAPKAAPVKDSNAVNRVIDATKDYQDADVEAAWSQAPDEPPLRGTLQARLGLSLRPAPIAFLGLWDTVPGSAFKKYADCREVPDHRPGERYKTGSYPSVARIAHALALDEKRSRFSPILLCPPMRPDLTAVDEQWFAGAHADVGGGYEMPGPSLSRISFAWMVKQLAEALANPLAADEPTLDDLMAPAHWSIGDAPANAGSDCVDRRRPANARLHPSVEPRVQSGRADLIVHKVSVPAAYPFGCVGPTDKSGPAPHPAAGTVLSP